MLLDEDTVQAGTPMTVPRRSSDEVRKREGLVPSRFFWPEISPPEALNHSRGAQDAGAIRIFFFFFSVSAQLRIATLHRDEHAQELRLNDVGRVRLRTTQPLFVDEYRRNRQTGGRLVDEATNFTVGAGMVVEAE